MAVNLSDPNWNRVYLLGVTLNIISIICASLILLTLLILGLHNTKPINRISLRLQAGIAILDILNHLNNIYHWSIPDGALCVLSAFFRVFGRQLYCFLNIAIVLNLQLIFIQKLPPNPNWELYYWIVPFLLAFMMNVVPLGLGMYGHNGERCFVKPNGYSESTLTTINIALVILFTFIYCSVITLIVMRKLKTNLSVVRNLAPTSLQMDPRSYGTIERNLRRLIYRIALYPIFAMISMFFYFIVYVLYMVNLEFFEISQLALLTLSLTGTLNLVAFVLDPTLHNAVTALISDLKSSYQPHIPTKLHDSLVNVELNPIGHSSPHQNNLDSTRLSAVGGDNKLHLL